MISLSPRLSAVCDLVPPCESIADIGTDHAYVPIFLTETGRIHKAVASDIHEGPAARAKEHIAAKGLSNRISVRIGSGFSPFIPDETVGAVMAGMGGLMMIQILKDGKEIADRLHFLVLQPQNHQKELRLWLSGNGYIIDAERLTKEGRQWYQILRIRRGAMEISETEAETGPLFLRKNDPLFPDFLKQLIRKKEFIIRGVSPDTNNEINAEKRRRALVEKKRLEEILCKYM